MRGRRSWRALIAASFLLPGIGLCADASDTRIALSANGETLTGTNGGGGASLGLLHSFDAESAGSVAVEHQGIANSNWTFGSVLGVLWFTLLLRTQSLGLLVAALGAMLYDRNRRREAQAAAAR